MRSTYDQLMHILMLGEARKEMRPIFESLGQGGNYTQEQKYCAFYAINRIGIRATADAENVKSLKE